MEIQAERTQRKTEEKERMVFENRENIDRKWKKSERQPYQKQETQKDRKIDQRETYTRRDSGINR